jgi:hypothetical protein
MNRKSMFFAASIAVFALLALLSGNAFAEGHILGVHNLALSIAGPSDGAKYNAGEPVSITVKTEGFTGINVSVQEDFTGAKESIPAVKPGGQPAGYDKSMWMASWKTKPGMHGDYTVSVIGIYLGKEVPASKKTLRIHLWQVMNVAQESYFESPKNGDKVKLGSEVRIVVDARGANRAEITLLNTATGKSQLLSPYHAQGQRFFNSSWFTDTYAPGIYKITAIGYLTNGTKVCESSVTVTLAR